MINYNKVKYQTVRKISIRPPEMLMQVGHVVSIKTAFIIALIFTVCAFSFPVTAADWTKYEVLGKEENYGIPGNYTWTIENRCNEPILLAVAFLTGYDRAIVKGWKHVEPESDFAIKLNSEYLQYYAVTTSNRLHWSGSANRPYYGINRNKDFEYVGDGLRDGPEKIQFVWISVIKEEVTTLTCR